MNIAYKCLQALAKKCNVYMVLGNHDLFNKNSVDVNSINIFRDNLNIHVVDSAVEIMLNGKKALLVPWLADLSNFKQETYDFLFGHFDISAKFLISSYSLEHSRLLGASNDVANELDNDKSLESSRNSQDNDLGNMLGSFIDLAKKNGTVFAGHIHQHREMHARGRKFIFIGSPYEQNLGDIGCRCGYYVISEDSSYKFIEINDLPKHVQFKSSDINRVGVDTFDFSSASSNIVQKVYDEDFSAEDDLEASKKIASFKPYEELLPDYRVAIDFTQPDDSCQGHLVKMLKSSKLDYIRSYIAQIDSSILEMQHIDRDKLLVVMEKYYRAAAGE